MDNSAMSLNCIFDTLNFIETHYNKPISTQELESISYYSYRNIQRIFKYTCGETIGAYQKRLRVEKAYKLLLYTKENLSLIALEVGFDNIASFSKAFKQHFGVSPREARTNKSVLFQENNIIPIQSDVVIKPEILYLPPIQVYYQSINTDYANAVIETLWSKMMSLGFQNHGIDYYGVIADEPLITDKIKCRYDACASMPSTKKQLPTKTILGGKYAKFLHRGSYETIEDTYTKIYANWILTSKMAFSPNPIIEQYIKHDSNTVDENDYLTAILLPLSV
jgi:AraC family transcriptional regulator